MSYFTPMKIIAIALLVLNLIFSQLTAISQIKNVSYKGAMGSKDWTRGWTNFTPGTTDYPATNEILEGIITTNTTLTSSITYLLKGYAYISNNATLTIEPGTIIRGDKESLATLIICNGSKIIAEGTESAPIIFTSNQLVGTRQPGDWGGIVVLGNAIINHKDGSYAADGILSSTLGKYGGSNSEDNSGVMKYVRLEFPGSKPNTEKQYNGLTMCGVGKKTKIDFIQVSHSKDDSFQWFGGNVNCNNLISYKSGDDDFDVTGGFSGTLQFGIAVRNPAMPEGSGSSCIESDSYDKGEENTYNTQILTSCSFNNFTLLSPSFTKKPNQDFTPHNKYAVIIKNNSKINIQNSMINGFKFGFLVSGDEVRKSLEKNQIKIRNTYVISAVSPFVGDFRSEKELNAFFNRPGSNNTFYKEYNRSVLKDPFNATKPVFLPIKGSFLTGN